MHTPGKWMAVEGDTLNGDRPWGIVVYLSREAHEEIDGEGCEYPTRTEVIAEVCGGADSEQVAADARLIAQAPSMVALLAELLGYLETDGMDEKSNLYRSAMLEGNAILKEIDGK